jgi:hypothetical protein
MCFGGDDGGNDAEKAAKQAANAAAAAEAKRKKDILAGRAEIDQNFAKFDDPYFKQIGDAYTGYYNPQLDDQYSKARDQLVYRFARQGIGQSQAAVDTQGDARTEYDRQRAQIGSRAQDAIGAAKSDVERNRGDLYTLNQAAADPEAVASMSASRAASIQPAQNLTPLENVFSSFLNSPATANLAYQYAANRPISPATFNSPGSVRTVY